MKKIILISFLSIFIHLVVTAQAVYVDGKFGDDSNPGTMEAPFSTISKAVEIIASPENDIYTVKINPGIYILDSTVTISTEKDLTNKRIVIEASILPDDVLWTPEKMPVIINSSLKGEIQGKENWIVSFLVDVNHLTLKGIKFLGYAYPNSRYYPIARINKERDDLLVEQCLFVGDEHASPIQVAIIAHGNNININHCIFYKTKNTVVYFRDTDGPKHGNSLKNSIIFGAYSTAIWTAWPDKEFRFENNIVSDCNFFWVKNAFNDAKYAISNCIILNQQDYKGVLRKGKVVSEEFEMEENNVTKDGKIRLRLIDKIDQPLPIDYLHIIPDSLGHDIGAGLFKTEKK